MQKFECDIVPLGWWDRFVLRVLRYGPIPNHLAIIMDGTRRYSKQDPLISLRDAYRRGRQMFWYVNSLCRELGVLEVTVYSFSIENLQRSAEEVTTLLEVILPDTLQRILDYEKLYRDKGVRMRVVGKKSLLSPRCRDLIQKVEDATKDNSRFVINMVICYGARDEMTTAMRKCVTFHTPAESITEECVASNLQQPRDVDCLIRTSGETRFSDFLLWQLDDAFVNIHQCLWPEFGLKNFVIAILNYQRNRTYLNR